MTAFMIIGIVLILLALAVAFRPRKKLTASKGNQWRNPNFQRQEKGESLSNSPPETTGYLGGGD